MLNKSFRSVISMNKSEFWVADGYSLRCDDNNAAVNVGNAFINAHGLIDNNNNE